MAVHALNRVEPMITLATVPEWQRIGAGGMVATIKIISYAVPEPALIKAEAAAQGALKVLRPTVTAAALIETRIGAAPDDKGRIVIAKRLAALGIALETHVLVPHETKALAQAITEATAPALLILTASATSDTEDVAPSALRLAGGQVQHFGMPVDPGNLLFFGRIGSRPVIGLPGCARSPALNGADWVMDRLLCGVPLTPDDIAQMGVGGLLKEIPSRPRPREG